MQTNTYQGTIITNTTSTYYIFSYTCGDIQWSGRGFEAATVGYNARADFFTNHPASGFPDIGRIISCTQQVASVNRRRRRQADDNTFGGTSDSGMEGRVATNMTLVNATIKCNDAVMTDKGYIPNITSIVIENEDRTRSNARLIDQVPACPPIIAIAKMPSSGFNRTEGSNCFVSNTRFFPDSRLNPTAQRFYQFASQCCYSSIG